MRSTSITICFQPPSTNGFIRIITSGSLSVPTCFSPWRLSDRSYFFWQRLPSSFLSFDVAWHQTCLGQWHFSHLSSFTSLYSTSDKIPSFCKELVQPIHRTTCGMYALEQRSLRLLHSF